MDARLLSLSAMVSIATIATATPATAATEIELLTGTFNFSEGNNEIQLPFRYAENGSYRYLFTFIFDQPVTNYSFDRFTYRGRELINLCDNRCLPYDGFPYGNAPLTERGNYFTSGRIGSVPVSISFTAARAGTVFFRLAAVPEPGTWALMILGFGFIGYSMRNRRHSVKVTFA